MTSSAFFKVAPAAARHLDTFLEELRQKSRSPAPSSNYLPALEKERDRLRRQVKFNEDNLRSSYITLAAIEAVIHGLEESR